ncbi:hypothetical protein RMT89_39250 [Streptomyces sp. P17]|nr:hypothetical protein [Streptomyces sp. P17]MDT9701736.1 hypothetical protein [Streptomyces sp. P17]
MLLDGYLRAEVGGDQRVRSGASSSDVPDKVLDGGPILTFRGRLGPDRGVRPGVRLGGGRGREEEAEASSLRA